MEGEQLVSGTSFIFIQDNRKETRVLKVSQHKNFKWRKMPVPLNQLTKYPYFTLFEVGNNKLSPVEWEYQEEGGQAEQEGEEEGTRNNKDIFLIEQAQKLQAEDIQKLKADKKPEEIIGELIQNNEQFDKRTSFSKQKYVKKKLKKYMFRIHAEPTSVNNLHTHYYRNYKENICGVRWDIFGLALLNGGPYGRVLLGEQGKGLFLGAVVERKPKSVAVVGSKSGAIRQYPIVDQLNIEKAVQEKIQFFDWDGLRVSEKLFDNFLLMGNYDFSGVVEYVQNNLASGCVITFVCLSLAPLEEVGRSMKEKGWLNVRIWDSWCRQYQVLKSRTHPMMNMDSCSGYLLSAIKI